MPRGGVRVPKMRKDTKQFRKQPQGEVRRRRPQACRCTGHSWPFRRAPPPDPDLSQARLQSIRMKGFLGPRAISPT